MSVAAPLTRRVQSMIALTAIGLGGVFIALPSCAAPALCDAAAIAAAQETGVPRDILLTLTRVETGRGGSDAAPDPWPWTLNMAGRGVWYHDADTALAAATRAVASGLRNIDIGCFQLNFRWHGSGFASLSAMLSPAQNARYAANFLRDLHDEFGDWTLAAGAFHSRTPRHATRYLARFHQIRAALPANIMARGPGPLAMAARPSFGAAQTGALVTRARPLATTAARPLWEIP
jgi:hypothetical protein